MNTNQFFTYSTSVVYTAQTGSKIGTLRIGGEKFIVDKITGYSATPTNITVLIKETNKNQNLSNASIPFSAIVGTAQLPFLVPAGTMVFDANQNVDVEFTNIGTTTETIYICFHGFKVRCS